MISTLCSLLGNMKRLIYDEIKAAASTVYVSHGQAPLLSAISDISDIIVCFIVLFRATQGLPLHPPTL